MEGIVTSSFDERLSEVERALKVIGGWDANPDLQSRAFEYLIGETEPAVTAPNLEPKPDSTDDTGAGGTLKPRNNASTKKSSKVSISQDKTLVTAPKGVQSWREFAAEKNPTNNDERNVAAVFWLKEIAEHQSASVRQIYTLFLDASWRLPTNPKNAAQIAGTKGFLDTADSEDITLTPRGIGLVKNDLPRAERKR